MASRTNYERETIITFNEAEKKANIYTWNPALIRKFQELAKKHPEQVKESNVHPAGSVCYDFPKQWIRFKPPVERSEVQKQAARIAIEKARVARQSKGKA